MTIFQLNSEQPAGNYVLDPDTENLQGSSFQVRRQSCSANIERHSSWLLTTNPGVTGSLVGQGTLNRLTKESFLAWGPRVKYWWVLGPHHLDGK